MTMEQRKAVLEALIAVLEAKVDKARSDNDWGRMRFFNESISSHKRTLTLLGKIYSIKE